MTGYPYALMLKRRRELAYANKIGRSIKPLKQSEEYNCGVYCLQFLLGLYGVHVLPEALEPIMGTTEEKGTGHEGIMKGLSHFNFKWVTWYNSHISTLQEFLPAIINYQYEDGKDGHYCVVLGQGHGFFIIYNPATGEIEQLDCEYLENNWYSERYGKGWFIQPVK
jgi:ABC-type bacteriocin/lantibiotic exporter with double-glycine peptidase domain